MQQRVRTKLFLAVLFIFLSIPVFAFANHGNLYEHKQNHEYPRLLNYYLPWTLSESKAKKLAKWDVVVLDMEQQEKNPELLRKMRERNEDIILLAYITPQEIRKDADRLEDVSPLRYELSQGIKDEWYLKDSQGVRLSWWPGTNLLNITEQAPTIGGQKLNDYMANFVADEIIASGLWDGVFYDNSWDNITYFAGEDVDINLDGKDEINWKTDQQWQSGMKNLYKKTRQLTEKNIILVGNNNTKTYTEQLNGMMLENFSQKSWRKTMGKYQFNDKRRRNPKVNMINNNTDNDWDDKAFKDMRFGLASSLMEDGYYSYDYGDENHGQIWWYDEYDINLGNPISSSESVYSNRNKYKSGVWTRDFENGLVVVNSTKQKKQIDLKNEYERINGESQVNDGSISSKLRLKSKDGRVLLKTFDTLKDIVFTNGYFAKLYKKSGDRVRNGFFVFDDEYNGGNKVAYIDLNGNEKREELVFHEGRLKIWRDDGQLYMRKSVFDDRLNKVSIAIGDIMRDQNKEIILAPTENSSAPIKIYSIYGQELKAWYPFGQDYNNGYSIAVGNFVGSGKQIAVRDSRDNSVKIYSSDLNQIRNWQASNFQDFSLAAGNIDGRIQDEIVLVDDDSVGVFDYVGNKIDSFDFSSNLPFGDPEIQVKVKDVDFDNKEDIILFEQL